MVLRTSVGQYTKDPFPVGPTAEHVSKHVPKSLPSVCSTTRVLYGSNGPEDLVSITVSGKLECSAWS